MRSLGEEQAIAAALLPNEALGEGTLQMRLYF